MPSSQPHQISKIINLVIALDPQSVLDVGVGFGKYGVLCREYLDLWDGREEYRRFKRRIDGIEVFKDYLTPIHDYVYDHVYIGNALDLVGRLDHRYDLVLLIDVLEHFTKEEGRGLVEKLLQHNRGLLISIPKNIGDQKDAFHNHYETHKGQWSKKELSQLGPSVFVQDATSHILYIGDQKRATALKRQLMLRSLLRTVKSFLIRATPVVSLYYFLKRRL